MTDGLAINISEPNMVRGDLPGIFREELQKVFNGSDIYHFEPSSGGIYAAAIDWVVISKVADVVGLASGIWLVYEKLSNMMAKGNKKLNIYISIDSEQGLHWVLGKTATNKDIFIEEFTSKVSKYKKGKRSIIVYENTVTKIKADKHWVNKHKGKGNNK